MGASPSLRDRLSDHSMASAIAIYVLVCIPIYLWLQGPVSDVGTVDTSVAIGGLLMGGLLFVPAVAIKLKRTYGGGQAERLGFVEEESDRYLEGEDEAAGGSH